jgi:hypothetical protein
MTRHQRLTPKSKGLKNHLLGHFLSTFAVAKVFRIHLRPVFPRISRATRGFTVEEGSLTAASPQTPGSGGEQTPRSACRPQAGQAVFNPRPTLTPSRGRVAESGLLATLPLRLSARFPPRRPRH